MGNVRSGRNIDSALQKKGFQCNTEGDHVHYHLLLDTGEQTTIKTKISHGMTGTINADLISKMARQLRLSKTQFLNLIDCPISEEDYRIILREQGVEA